MKKTLFGLGFSALLVMVTSQYGGYFLADTDQDYYSDDQRPMMWQGPGWYYGLWFQDRGRYDMWVHYHWHQRNQQNSSN